METLYLKFAQDTTDTESHHTHRTLRDTHSRWNRKQRIEDRLLNVGIQIKAKREKMIDDHYKQYTGVPIVVKTKKQG